MPTTLNKKIFILLTVLSVPAVYFLLRPGFYEPHDLHHIADIYQMYRAILSGQIPPRWGPDFSYGYGYPLFNYYYVMSFYIGALFLFVTNNLTLSFKLVMITASLTSVIFMYMFLRELVGKYAAVTGSILYLYTPYRAVQMYVRGAMGEVFISALLPLVAWIFIRLIRKKDARTIFISSFILSVFILSHNYLSFMSIPFILFLLIPIMAGKKDIKYIKKSVISIILSILISLLMTSYWWIPALFERGLVGNTTPFPLIDHFPFIKQLLIPSWGYGASLWGDGDGLSFQIGIVNIVVVGFFGLLLVLGKLKTGEKGGMLKRVGLLSFIVFFLLLFFMNVRSYPIWKLVPFYDFIQFPWRLLIYTTFISAILSVVIVESLKNKAKYIAGLLIIIGSIAFNIGYFKPDITSFKTDNEYLSRFFPNRTMEGYKNEVSLDYLGYSEDYLLLPVWVKERPPSLPKNKIEALNGNINNITEKSAINYEADVEVKSESDIIFHSYYFPGWTVRVDGQKTQPNIYNESGIISIKVPEGTTRVSFSFEETGFRKIFDILSLATAIIGICVIFNLKRVIERQ